MYFIHTTEFGFETEQFPSREDAAHEIAKLMQLRGYQGTKPTIYWIDESTLLANCTKAER